MLIGQNIMNEHTSLRLQLCALNFTLPQRHKHNHRRNHNFKKRAIILSMITRMLIISVGIIWLALRAHKMKRILCSDWLPEWARWTYLARSGLPALVPRTKTLLEVGFHSSLTLKDETIYKSLIITSI